MLQRPPAGEMETFAGLLLRHRGRTGLTQRDLAAGLGTTRRSVQDWESGAYYPSAERLQALILVLLESGGLTVGREAVEAHELWAAALRDAPRMHTPLDEVWLAQVLDRRSAFTSAAPSPLPARPSAVAKRNDEASAEASHEGEQASRERHGDVTNVDQPSHLPLERRQDWGEAPDVIGFVGRTDELATLRNWVLDEHCRLAGVLGMGGIGKTALTSRLAQDAAPSFQRVYWRSLRDALPAGEWMAGAIGFLAAHDLVPPQGESARLAVLLQLLRDQPSLLVLDNFETVLEAGQQEGRYRDGFGGYGALLQAIGETRHQSCLVVTSREAPPELAVLGGGGVRRLQLGGLGVREGQVLLADKQLSGSDDDWTNLVARFAGNGLALKVVGESIRQVFDGDISAFLDQAGSGSVFGGIRRLLAEQLERSSALEQMLLRVLAVEREPVSIADLIAALGPRVSRGAVLEAVEALRRRSLVERAASGGLAAFTPQSVVLAYVTDRLVEDVVEEVERAQPLLLVQQALVKAQAKDYVRQSQERLIGAPILQLLAASYGKDGAEERLLGLLEVWRGRPEVDQGYGPGNVVNLVRLLRGNLRGLDLSRLAIRQAYLAEVDAQDTSLVDAHLAAAILADVFDLPLSVALSGDGTSLAAGTSTGEVWLWRVADRTLVAKLTGHTGGVRSVALSADGQLLASGSEDGTIRLWETPFGNPLSGTLSAGRGAAPAAGGQLLATLQGNTGQVWAVALSADGQLLVSGSENGTIHLWQAPFVGHAAGGQPLATLHGHIGAVWTVALAADGQRLASGGFDGTVRLWAPAPETGWRLAATLEGHASAVWGVALAADGQLLASGSGGGTVRLWNATNGRLLATLQGHTSGVWAVALAADGHLLASGSGDGTARLWDPSVARLQATLRGHTSVVRGVALSADGQLLASAGFDGAVRLWEASTGRPLATLLGRTDGVRSVAVSADSQLLVSGSLDGAVRVWETSTSQVQATLQGHTGTVRGVALAADAQLLATSGEDGTVRLWETRSGRLLSTLQGHTGGVWGVALSADGRLLASGGGDGAVRLWERATGRLLGTLQGHTSGVWGVALSADGRLLASGGGDGAVRLWQPSTNQLLATLHGHTGAVWGVALTLDGGLLASGGGDGTARVWEASTSQLLTTVAGHSGAVWSVALAPDRRLLATGGGDGTVRLWEASTGQPRATLQGHTGGVWGLAFSAESNVLASGGEDGTVRLWNPGTGSSLQVLRSARRYEGVDITGLTGLTAAQRTALLALGAVEH
ncbi:MAG TPA: helix-turn-helix domain-containing protein [Chloroflexota bacterium]|nr:helix-turn-helix domain-containing protein [Chloroflexota bacterium]